MLQRRYGAARRSLYGAARLHPQKKGPSSMTDIYRLYIDGAWRDHRLYAVTREEVPEGMLARLRASGNLGDHPEPQ